MTQPTHKFKPVLKDQLFYNKFEYAVNFAMPEVTALREISHEHIDYVIERRKIWREVAQQRWGFTQANTPLSRLSRQFTDQMVQNLHDFADFLMAQTVDFKLVVSVDTAWLYSNDLDLINTVSYLPYVKNPDFSQAVVDRPRNTIKLKRTDYQWRSYFRAVKLTNEQKDNLERFLTSQAAHIRCSPALVDWMAFPFNRVHDYFFVDYNGETWLTMLALVQPGLIRKTMQIIPAK